MKKALLIILPLLALSVLILPITLSDFSKDGEDILDGMTVSDPDYAENRKNADDRTDADGNTPLCLGVGTVSGVFNPFFCENENDSDIVNLTQIKLIDVSADGSAEFGLNKATLAYSMTVEEFDDGSVAYTFVLKNGIECSNGRVLCADDVLFNLYVYLDPLYKGPSALSSLGIAGLSEYRIQSSDGPDLIKSISGICKSSVTCADGIKRDTVTVRLTKADGFALYKFDFPVAPLDYYAGEQRAKRVNGTDYFGVDYNSPDFMAELSEKNNLPVGAGPYYVSDEDNASSDCLFTLTANDSYLLGAPNIRRINVKEVEESAAYAVNTENVDICRTSPSVNLTELISGDVSYSGLDSFTVSGNGFGFICVNPVSVSDIRERRAILYTLNTSLIIDYYANGAEILNRPFDSTQKYYPASAGSPYTYDKSGGSSLALYEEMGCTLTDGVMRREDGTAVEYVFCLPSNTSSHPAGMILLNSQDILRSLGIRVEIITENDISELVLNDNVTLWAAEFSTGKDPDLYSLFCADSSVNSSPFPNYLGLYSIARNGTAQEKELITAMNGEIADSRFLSSDAEISALYSSILDKITELSVILPTCNKTELWVYNKSKIVSSTILTDGKSVSPFDIITSLSLKN